MLKFEFTEVLIAIDTLSIHWIYVFIFTHGFKKGPIQLDRKNIRLVGWPGYRRFRAEGKMALDTQDRLDDVLYYQRSTSIYDLQLQPFL